MLTCGTGGTVTVLLHGGGVLFGVHTPPLGGVAVAVFATCAGGFALTVAVTVYVAELPAGNVANVSLNAPVPEAFGHTAPPLAAQLQPWLAMPAAIGSATTVPAALTEPVLLTTIVYTTVPLGVAVVVFALFAMLTCGTGGTVTVLLHGGGVLFGVHTPPLGGVAVAVLVTVAGGVAMTVAVTV
jgi:hypothetical protein